ncbi:hypothetical protein DdX_12019 [Ditylenchus destructor]|uniref:Uncharacterized protein n=1 Tax=Ditylenchus destructor TaxID=166010 RepID=A0AAD4MZI6_9BILA|nr:hypothetical protein DdX_12019 [Ditylenchus destructor]
MAYWSAGTGTLEYAQSFDAKVVIIWVPLKWNVSSQERGKEQSKRSSLPPIRVVIRKSGTIASKRQYPATKKSKSDGEISSDDEPSQTGSYAVQTPKRLSPATRNGRSDGKNNSDVALTSMTRP